MPPSTLEQPEFSNPEEVKAHEHGHLLGRYLGRQVRQEWEIAELLSANAELEYVANHDSMTGLLNRRGLEAYLKQSALDHCIVLFADATNLKAVNDIFDHEAGDQAIINIAKILTKSVRADDAVARVGGDEFIVIIKPNRRPSEEGEGEIITAADQLRDVATIITERTKTMLSENPDLFVVGFDIAIGSAIGEPGIKVKTLIRVAEEKMNENKADQHDESGGAYRPKQP